MAVCVCQWTDKTDKLLFLLNLYCGRGSSWTCINTCSVELGSTTKIMLNNQIVICRPHSRQPSFRVFGNSALVASQVML